MLGVPLVVATLRTPDRYSDAFIVMKTRAAPVATVPVAPACDTSTWRALGWYRATGTLRVEEDSAGQPMPVFKIESMTPSEPPRNLMMW